MTPTRRAGPGLVLSLAAILAAGCASGGQGGRVDFDPDAGAADTTQVSEDESIRIEVTNHISPPSSVVVYVLQNTGARQRLGRVQPGRTGSFEYRPQTEARRIRLLARTNQGEIFRSRAFTVSQAGVVRWEFTGRSR